MSIAALPYRRHPAEYHTWSYHVGDVAYMV